MKRILAIGLLCVPILASGEQVYGVTIPPPEGVREEVEACEYRLLVEKSACTWRLNKTECFHQIHKLCRQNPRAKASQVGPKQPAKDAARDRRKSQ